MNEEIPCRLPVTVDALNIVASMRRAALPIAKLRLLGALEAEGSMPEIRGDPYRAQHRALGAVRNSLHPNEQGGSKKRKVPPLEVNMKTYSIREVLENIDKMPNSWFYMPDLEWNLETRGSFSLDSRDFPPGSTDYLPAQVASHGWKETLDTPMIEDVIANADQQLSSATVDDYFEAFKFYYENDAFKVFQKK